MLGLAYALLVSSRIIERTHAGPSPRAHARQGQFVLAAVGDDLASDSVELPFQCDAALGEQRDRDP